MRQKKITNYVKRQLKRFVASALLASVMVTSMPMTGVYAAVRNQDFYEETDSGEVRYRFTSEFTNQEETQKKITLEAYSDSEYTVTGIQSPDGKIQGGGYTDLHRR